MSLVPATETGQPFAVIRPSTVCVCWQMNQQLGNSLAPGRQTYCLPRELLQTTPWIPEQILMSCSSLQKSRSLVRLVSLSSRHDQVCDSLSSRQPSEERNSYWFKTKAACNSSEIQSSDKDLFIRAFLEINYRQNIFVILAYLVEGFSLRRPCYITSLILRGSAVYS